MHVAKKPRWIQIHEELARKWPDTGEHVAEAACKLAVEQEARIDELESAARTYLAAVDEESGQAIALEALRKALGGTDA